MLGIMSTGKAVSVEVILIDQRGCLLLGGRSENEEMDSRDNCGIMCRI